MDTVYSFSSSIKYNNFDISNTFYKNRAKNVSKRNSYKVQNIYAWIYELYLTWMDFVSFLWINIWIFQLDCNSKHVVQAWRKTYFFLINLKFAIAVGLNKCLKTDKITIFIQDVFWVTLTAVTKLKS